MWKIYVTLMLWTQSLNAQEEVYTQTSRGASGKNTFQTSDLYNEYNYNKRLTRAAQLTSHMYNQNSRHSFQNTSENDLFSYTKETQPNATSPIERNISAKSPIFGGNSTTWKVPVGNSFNSKLFDIMSTKTQHENLVYSPFSLQTLLAFIFTISGGKLSEELAGLLATSNNRTHVAKTFENILQTPSLNMPPTTLIMANKLYYDYRLGPIDQSVRYIAKKSFASEIEQIDFYASKEAASVINSWVSERTRNLIQDIVTPSSISDDTSALLLNSIYFKSDWLTKFDIYDTETQDFFTSQQTQVPVDMMYNEDIFRYGDFQDDLQASVVELPYKTANLTMLLILPKETEGLPDLERKLRYYDLESISQKLKRETVTVKLPRFKIEYEIDMIKPLQEMGLNALFNNVGSINLFQNQQKPLKIDQFKHKSFIHVNEAGTEATATSVAKYVPLSIPFNMKYFVADHPFVFVIRNANTTFFMGHVMKF